MIHLIVSSGPTESGVTIISENVTELQYLKYIIQLIYATD